MSYLLYSPGHSSWRYLSFIWPSGTAHVFIAFLHSIFHGDICFCQYVVQWSAATVLSPCIKCDRDLLHSFFDWQKIFLQHIIATYLEEDNVLLCVFQLCYMQILTDQISRTALSISLLKKKKLVLYYWVMLIIYSYDCHFCLYGYEKSTYHELWPLLSCSFVSSNSLIHLSLAPKCRNKFHRHLLWHH